MGLPLYHIIGDGNQVVYADSSTLLALTSETLTVLEVWIILEVHVLDGRWGPVW